MTYPTSDSNDVIIKLPPDSPGDDEDNQVISGSGSGDGNRGGFTEQNSFTFTTTTFSSTKLPIVKTTHLDPHGRDGQTEDNEDGMSHSTFLLVGVVIFLVFVVTVVAVCCFLKRRKIRAKHEREARWNEVTGVSVGSKYGQASAVSSNGTSKAAKPGLQNSSPNNPKSAPANGPIDCDHGGVYIGEFNNTTKQPPTQSPPPAPDGYDDSTIASPTPLMSYDTLEYEAPGSYSNTTSNVYDSIQI